MRHTPTGHPIRPAGLRLPPVQRRRWHTSLATLVVLLLACDSSPRRPLEQATRGIQRQHIAAHGRYLSSDGLGGRHFATAEAESTVAYILRQLHAQGIPQVDQAQALFAARPCSFSHAFGATLFRLGPSNRVGVLFGEEQRSLRLGQDYLPLVHSRSEQATGRLHVFLREDDLENPAIDLRGHVVLLGPGAIRPRQGEAMESTLHRLTRRVEARGAAAVVFAGIDTWSHLRTTRYASQLPRDQIELARSPRGQRLNLHIDRLVLQTQAEAWRLAPTSTIPALVLGPGLWRNWRNDIEVGVQIDLQQEVSLGQNILVGFGGQQMGRDVVLLLAHVDHSGVNAAGDVLNGADDNASGVAALLGITAALERVADRLQGPVLVAFVSGELLGLQGTNHLLRDFHTLFGERRIGCALILDGIGRNGSDRLIVRSTTATVQQRRALETHNRRSSLLAPALLIESLRAAPTSTARHGVRQHDTSHDLLEAAGIPSLLFNDGLDPYLYGQPEDDWKRIDTRKVTRIARLVFRITADLALHPAALTLPAAQP